MIGVHPWQGWGLGGTVPPTQKPLVVGGVANHAADPAAYAGGVSALLFCAHFFAVLLLLAASEGNAPVVTLRLALFRLPLVAIALYGIMLSFQLFCASITLGNFETARLADRQSITRLHVPWLMQMRYQRDITLLHLANFNEHGDLGSWKYSCVVTPSG